jgi:hypothetical protein
MSERSAIQFGLTKIPSRSEGAAVERRCRSPSMPQGT